MNGGSGFSEMRRLVRLAGWAALIALGGWVSLPIGPVPITLQTFFIFLAAFVEGAPAAFSTVLYLVAGLMGLPVFSGGQAGPAIVFGPTAGYALSFPLMAAVCGLGRLKVLGPIVGVRPFVPWSYGPYLIKMLGFGLLGLALLYLCGSIGLVINLGLSFPAALGLNLTFVPGDLVKMFVAATLSCDLARASSKTSLKKTASQA
jgi:biotin transport system substrate-specific component